MTTRQIGLRAPIAPAPALPVPEAHDPTHPAPEPLLPSIIDVLDPSSNTNSSSGMHRYVHVQPDERFPIISFIYSVSHTMAQTSYNKYPFASPASIIGYSLTMLTGLLYHCDASLTPVPSPQAREIMDDSLLTLIFSTMLDLPIPPFMSNELNALRPFIGDLATNMAFFPTLASATFLMDFGRIIPANTFFALHNLMASLPGNSSTATLLESFYKTTIVDATIGNINYTITPAHLFGYVLEQNNEPQRYSNWLNERVNILINALAIRPVNAMSTPGHLPLTHPAYTDADDFNPYLLGIGFSQGNSTSIVQILRSLGQFVKDVYPSAQPLRNYTQPGTLEICRYLSSSVPFPTWHTLSTGLTNANQVDIFSPSARHRTHRQFADDTAFLGIPPDPTTAPSDTNSFFNLQRYPRPADADFFSAQLVETNAPPAGTADPTAFIRPSDPRSGATPNWIIFDPSANTTTHLASVLISGKIIETGDIDSTNIVLEDTETSLFRQNGILFSGLIPFSQVKNAVTTRSIRLLSRPVNTTNDFPIVLFRGSSQSLWLPVFRQGIVRTETIAARPTLASLFPNFDLRHHSRRSTYGTNALCSTFGSNYPHMQGGDLRIWSSYRIEHTSQSGQRSWYFITTLRPTFGYIARVFSTLHPALRIP